jgi:hypothetical protein
MQLRSRTLLAWLVFLTTLGCLVGGLVVTLAVTRPLTSDVLVHGAFEGAIWLLFATVGLVLTLRRPGNPIGWLYADPAPGPGRPGRPAPGAAGRGRPDSAAHPHLTVAPFRPLTAGLTCGDRVCLLRT